MTDAVMMLTIEALAPYLEQIVSAQYVALILLGAILIHFVFFGRR